MNGRAEPPLVVEHVDKWLGARKAVRDASLSVGRGEVCALVGSNGSGKSTLLRVVVGVLGADRGAVRIAGASLGAERTRALQAAGYLGERADIPEWLTGSEWLNLIASVKGCGREARDVATFGLASFVHQRAGSMSLGQQRKIGLTAALLGSPALLVLDEPTNGLDDAALGVLADVLVKHCLAGGGALVATHDTAFATRVGARVVRIEAGAVA